MKTLLFTFLCVFTLSANAMDDCGVQYLNTDPYTPDSCGSICQPIPIGTPEHWVTYYFDDGSRREWDVQTYLACDGTTYDEFVPGSEQIFCPHGPGYPCHATDPVYAY